MPRPNKIWFRKDIGCWMVTFGGKRIRLAAEQPKAPEAPNARVADVIEAFLGWTKIHRGEETNSNYLWFGQAFSWHSGYLPVGELKPIYITRWVDVKPAHPFCADRARVRCYLHKMNCCLCPVHRQRCQRVSTSRTRRMPSCGTVPTRRCEACAFPQTSQER